jgi:hypothetical protein
MAAVSRETSCGAEGLFHVKQRFHEMNLEILLSNAKLPEDRIQNILDIDPAE